MSTPASTPHPLLSTDIERAVAALRAGGLVGMPTETVYGLAADAHNTDAVGRVYSVKGRPRGHPLIVHLAPNEPLERWIADDRPHRGAAESLAAALWPGPVTLIVPAAADVIGPVTGNRPTVGLRRPAHPVAIELLERFGGGVAAPSANRFGRVSPTTARHVLDDVGELLDQARDVVLDGGDAMVGVESTIVDLAGDDVQLLRPGAITADQVSDLIARPVLDADGPSRASGMLAAHYAPTAAVHLADSAEDAEVLADGLRTGGFRVTVVDRTADLADAARWLYRDLRAADRAQLDAVVVVLPPAEGLGLALRDRLSKAATGSARSNRSD